MRQHRDWQEQATAELAAEVISEVAVALDFVKQVQSGEAPERYRRLKCPSNT